MIKVNEQKSVRKIIHVDMDCFYAAIEIRDNPELANKPVAVGGAAEDRGVLCTSNYIARQYGVKSAMATATALRLCKDLILLPVDMAKYRRVANQIHHIFKNFTDIIEPLSLDEAYLDVSHASHYQGSATLIAEAIRRQIWESEQLTASAGVAPNKFLAKVASGWKKPNGLFVIRPRDVSEFVKALPVQELFGVGKVTAEKLNKLGVKTCFDLQQKSLADLDAYFGKLGQQLYDQCRGMDNREVLANRVRKSLSVEHTFPKDIFDRDMCIGALNVLSQKLTTRIKEHAATLPIKNQFIKIKFNNFRQITTECASSHINFDVFKTLFLEAYAKIQLPIRLLGVGVHFQEKEKIRFIQQTLF